MTGTDIYRALFYDFCIRCTFSIVSVAVKKFPPERQHKREEDGIFLLMKEGRNLQGLCHTSRKKN